MCELIASIGVGFTEPVIRGRISIETVGTIIHITKWQRLITRQKLHGDLRANEVKFLLDYEPWENIDDVNFCLKCLPQSQKRHSFERALCIALIFYIYNAFGKLPWTAAYKRLREELTALVRGYTPRSEERKCMTWIRIAAMASWKGRSSLTPEGLVLIRELVREHFLHNSSWADLEVIFHQFLWDEQLGRDWKSTWEAGKCASYAAADFDIHDKQADRPL